MTNEEKEQRINQWSLTIVPAVLKAECILNREHPEWAEQIKKSSRKDYLSVLEKYYRAIAELIVERVTR